MSSFTWRFHQREFYFFVILYLILLLQYVTYHMRAGPLYTFHVKHNCDILNIAYYHQILYTASWSPGDEAKSLFIGLVDFIEMY